jgi:hypothetical protein
MKTMVIKWQRLVDSSGQTCERCSNTGDATEEAFRRLKGCLAEVGIEVLLEKRVIDQTTFDAEPLQSNLISIDGRTVEEWLGGRPGQSSCCGPCGDSECRTIRVDDHMYEAIPANVILRAGLLAAAERLK